jgi:hypothetical protein
MDVLALLAIAPQPGFDHPQPQRFPTNCDPLILAQLLGPPKSGQNPSTTGG